MNQDLETLSNRFNLDEGYVRTDRKFYKDVTISVWSKPGELFPSWKIVESPYEEYDMDRINL